MICILQSCVYKSLLLFVFNVIVSSPAVNLRVYNKKIQVEHLNVLLDARSNRSIIRLIQSVHTRRQVAATCRGDILQWQIASCLLEKFVKIFVAATEFCRHNKSHWFSLIWFFATCCSDKILLRRQRFSQKFSSTHEAICRCDVSPHLVAATSRPTCTHGVICRRDVLLQLVA